MSDFRLTDHGSVLLLLPVTQAAQAWAEANLPEDAPTLGRSVAVEPRCIADIIDGIHQDGMTVA